MIRYFNRFIACRIGWKSRAIRAGTGIAINTIVLFLIDYIPPFIFWSILVASYSMVLEAFVGCSLLHWVYKLNTSPTDDTHEK
ncbi:MAG: hypothetical protein ACK4NC_03340 [Candidatus Gracilibacteria bacterium]